MRWRLVLVFCLLGTSLWAHPIPKDNHDRRLVVTLTPSAVLIDYRLEVDEARAREDLDLASVDLTGIRNREEIHAIYLKEFETFIRNNLVVRLDGKEVPLTTIRQRNVLLDHICCDYRFSAAWKLQGDSRHSFSLYEGAFAGDSVSALYMLLQSSPELTVTDEVIPTGAFLSSDRVRRSMSATVRAVPSQHIGLVRVGLPPESDPGKPGARGRDRFRVARSKPGPETAVGLVRSTGPSDDVEETPTKHSWNLLDLLLDSRQGFGILLLLAGGFGAVHALTPGHGKTMVAAYLVGERGTIGHAILLGVVTTLTHTGSVLVVAALLPMFFAKVPPATVQAVLGLVGGLLIAGLGMWLLMTRLTGRADHIHLDGGHSHGTAEMTPGRQGWWGVVVLGIGGGLVPCWDAIALLLWSISTNRLWMGLPLLLAFSAGLAAVLVILGIVVVRAKSFAQSQFGESKRFQRVVAALPILSALVLTILGLWLCFESTHVAT